MTAVRAWLAAACFLVAVCSVSQMAFAQIGLVVDGRDVPGVTSTLVPGISYAPAGELAVAVGAELWVDPAGASATLALGGRFLELPIVETGADAAAAAGTLDGAPVAAGAAVRSGVEIFLPVKTVVETFGGTVAYLQEEQRVMGVMPRADVLDATVERVGQVERLRIRVSAPVPYSSFTNDALATMQVRFARTSLARAQTLEGATLVRTDLIPGRGVVDVRIQLAPGVEARTSALPAGNGFELLVEARVAGSAPTSAARPRVVVDPGHGGDDPGLTFGDGAVESELAWTFADRLVPALRAEGIDATTTRQGNEPVSIEGRSAAGVGSDLFVSVHAADLPAGQFRVYFLGDAASPTEMDFAIRQNAAAEAADAATDSVRRQILLELVPELGTGRRYAAALGNVLFQLGGYRSADTAAAPIAVLTGAAGRGLLLEFAPSDLASESLPELLATALASVLGSGGFE